MLKESLSVGVFCSASDVAEKYTDPAREFARLIGEHGHSLVWGGSNTGVMRIMATGVQEAGGKIFGVSVEYLKHKVLQGADEMIIAADLLERKATILKRSNVIVMMVGGIGTIDEATDVIEHKKHGHHDKPVIVLNTDGFYDGFEQQLQRMDAEGFLPKALGELVFFAATPLVAIDYIDQVARLPK